MSMVPDSVRQFRTWYRQEQIPKHYSGLFHFLFTSGVSLGPMVYALRSLNHPRAAEWLTVPLTFLYANAVEYFAHKYPMHRRLRFLGLVFQRHALEHHRYYTHDAMSLEDPEDIKMVLFPPILVLFFFGLFAFPAGLVAGRLISPNVGCLFLATAMAYFLNYEWLHLLYHMPETSFFSRLLPVAGLRRHHREHHDMRLMARYNFNITYPLCDWIFGTRHRGV